MLETDACAAGEQTKLFSVYGTAQSSIFFWSCPEQDERTIKQITFEVGFGMRDHDRYFDRANGELMRRVFHRTCSFSDVCFLDQSLGFPDCWISLNRSLIFRLRSASSSHF